MEDITEMEIKEEPIFEEIDPDDSFEIKKEEQEPEECEAIKIEIFPEPKCEVVEEEPVSYDTLNPNDDVIVDNSDRSVNILLKSQTSEKKKPKPKANKYKAKVKHMSKKLLQCNLCKMKFFSAHTLNLHERTHTECATFVCENCSEVFTTLGSLMEHQKKKKHFKIGDLSQDKMHSQSKRKYKCKSCSLVFFSEKTFRFHVKIHAGLLKYSCDVCEEMFNTLSDLSFHRERFGHGMKCQECGTICATIEEMEQHQKMHTKWKFYKCEDCNFSTVLQKHLRQHKATSCPGPGRGPILCSFCDTLFKNEDIYSKHSCPAKEDIKLEEPIVTVENIPTDSNNIVNVGLKEEIVE